MTRIEQYYKSTTTHHGFSGKPKGRPTTCFVARGKPAGAKTFGDPADVKFVEHALVSGKFFKRIDVTFDRYIDKSTKSSTRKIRSMKACPIPGR